MVHVQPPAWRKADLPQLAAAKQTVLCAWSPRDNTLASFTTTSQVRLPRQVRVCARDQPCPTAFDVAKRAKGYTS